MVFLPTRNGRNIAGCRVAEWLVQGTLPTETRFKRCRGMGIERPIQQLPPAGSKIETLLKCFPFM